MKQIKHLIFKCILIGFFVINFYYLSYSQESRTNEELIKNVTTRPWAGKNYPDLPDLPIYLRSNVVPELADRETRKAYVKLDARRRNTDWFSGIEELEKQKAIWSLLSCLTHPSEDVQINALRSLERLKDKRSVPFLLIYAEYMAVFEGGSENATIHGIIQESIANTLSTITTVAVRITGQDPEGLKAGIELWRKWLLENKN